MGKITRYSTGLAILYLTVSGHAFASGGFRFRCGRSGRPIDSSGGSTYTLSRRTYRTDRHSYDHTQYHTQYHNNHKPIGVVGSRSERIGSSSSGFTTARRDVAVHGLDSMLIDSTMPMPPPLGSGVEQVMSSQRRQQAMPPQEQQQRQQQQQEDTQDGSGLANDLHRKMASRALDAEVAGSGGNEGSGVVSDFDKREISGFELVTAVANDEIKKLAITEDGAMGTATTMDGRKIKVRNIPISLEMFKILGEKGVQVSTDHPGDSLVKSFIAKIAVPFVIVGAIAAWFSNKDNKEDYYGGAASNTSPYRDNMGPMGGPGSQLQQFSKSKSKLEVQPNTNKTFKDVAGVEEAKQELMEIVEFLRDASRFEKLGAKIPKGVLLEGPPGTGKTLLAKAVSGEAGVAFVSAAGSGFVELFVGIGASRVRDLFDTARKNTPCIMFIDEIDAVGRQRGTGIAGGNDEREQTLNEILAQMDGFEGTEGVIVLAATNRPDILDPALLRAGRFDRRVQLSLPDFHARTEILKVHSRNKPLAADVDFESIARRTPGFSGATLESLMNEAAINAARAYKTEIDDYDIDQAIDRIIVGMEKKGVNPLLRNKELVAYHEAGHALVGALLTGHDEVQKVTIIPRTSGAGGITFFEPNEVRVESGMYSRSYLEGQLAVALAGRTSEELVFGSDEVTTGAVNDIHQVTEIAKRMVSEWGFSDVVGNVQVSAHYDNPFLGRRMAMDGSGWSNQKMQQVDSEVDRIVSNAHKVARSILVENRVVLDIVASELIERETISGYELLKIIEDAQAHSYQLIPVSDKGKHEKQSLFTRLEQGNSRDAGVVEPKAQSGHHHDDDDSDDEKLNRALYASSRAETASRVFY